MSDPKLAKTDESPAWTAFERAVDAVVKSGPQHKAARKTVPPDAIDLFRELNSLLNQDGCPRSGADSVLKIIDHLRRCFRFNLVYKSAPLTGKAIIVPEPTDLFLFDVAGLAYLADGRASRRHRRGSCSIERRANECEG